MSETLKCIVINSKDLKAMFAKILIPENMNLVRGQIPIEVLSQTALKKISRCFNELSYPAGHVFVEEGAPFKSIYIVKSGTCEIYSK